MAETTEPRALSAALAAPAFATRGAGLAMHAADRHVERWAPEAGAARVRPLRSLGFVDRLIAPWMETAQRSASMRLFGQYTQAGFAERTTSDVSWVFPRPWYQDELNWMAAARRTAQTQGEQPAMFTTRGTYVTPEQRAAQAMPSALYEFVAPSMSVAAPVRAEAADAYSPLIPLAAVQAASLMTRAMAPVMAPATARMSPALRTVLSSMMDRAAASEVAPSRLAMSAPELVTPPAPRAPAPRVEVGAEQQAASGQVVEQYAAQHTRIVELQRIAQQAAQREMAARTAEQTRSGELERAADVREAARRAEAQLREVAAARTDEQRQKIEAGATAAERASATAERARVEAERTNAAAAERARLEERVAQRLAERGSAQRLHEQARTEAAAHARAAAAPAAESPAIPAVEERAAARPPAEVTAAVAALPPEMAAFIGQRPERVLQAIDELDVALRTIDLIARSAAAGTSFEVTRGPRLVMPAGLGGLVSAVDRAHALRAPDVPAPGMSGAAAGAAISGAPGVAGPAAFGPAAFGASRAGAQAARVPALPWLTSPSAIYPRAPFAPAATSGAPASAAPTALGAAAASAPAGLGHVAWADRWLARFAGASPVSLATLDAARDSSSRRFDMLASEAPNVFVAPSWSMGAPAAGFDIERAAPARDVQRLMAAAEQRPAEQRPIVQLPTPTAAIRYADDAETPDDVFAAISASAARQRTTTAATADAPRAQAASSSAAAAAPAAIFDRMPADMIATSAPAAPHAGMAAQLAASPFAPALRHVMPMPSAASFDVRSLFGGLSSTYLAGLLSEASQELEIAPRGLPSWAAPDLLSSGAEAFAERTAPAWDAAYVAPDALDAPRGADAESIEYAPAAVERAAATEYAASHAAAIEAQQQLAAMAPLTTMRAALLSWTADVPATGPAAAMGSAAAGAAGFGGTDAATLSSVASLPLPTARAMLESMSMPMLGDVMGADEPGGAWMAPGMVASRAHRWSVAQERSASDLSLDFVTPELVLAARVYGLGPSEAAQAARLAIAGSGHLTAMAGTVDRAFVQALAMDADRRDRRIALTTAYPDRPADRPADRAAEHPAADRMAATDLPVVAPTAGAAAERPDFGRAGSIELAAAAGSAGTAFGVDRRAPRGAFLWPSASVAALGLHAAPHEGAQAMSVAALELLAARAVAELGTLAVLDDPAAPGRTGDAQGATSAGTDSATGAPSWTAGAAPRALPIGADPARAFETGAPVEPAERDVLAAAQELVPQARRARFEALYLALGQTSGQRWSPAARAARALALAGRAYEESDAPLSARERAATAWEVLPVVYATEAMSDDAGALAAAGLSPDGAGTGAAFAGRAALDGRSWASSGAAPSARTQGGAASVSSAPGTLEWAGGYAGAGLGALSARAGEALGSYVAPSMATPEPERSSSSWSSSSSSSSPDRSELGAVHRAPTAMQELVRTGRPAGRYGGGEVELPPWFEAAARKMFESQGTPSDGISIAELTLVTAAPASHIAASTRGTPAGAAPVSPGAGSAPDKANAGGGGAANIDVETLANEIYRHILTLMDAARARNGEPYL